MEIAARHLVVPVVWLAIVLSTEVPRSEIKPVIPNTTVTNVLLIYLFILLLFIFSFYISASW